MKNTEKAFHWITNILEQKGIAYKISGGFAARVYGVDRELADIDINAEDKDIPLISEWVRPYIVFGPARYRDDSFDLELMTLSYEGQEIDIAGTRAKIFDQEKKVWEDCVDDLDDIEMKEVFGKKVPVEKMESLIAYKSKLAREVDLEDVKQLKIIATTRTGNSN